MCCETTSSTSHFGAHFGACSATLISRALTSTSRRTLTAAFATSRYLPPHSSSPSSCGYIRSFRPSCSSTCSLRKCPRRTSESRRTQPSSGSSTVSRSSASTRTTRTHSRHPSTFCGTCTSCSTVCVAKTSGRTPVASSGPASARVLTTFTRSAPLRARIFSLQKPEKTASRWRTGWSCFTTANEFWRVSSAPSLSRSPAGSRR
mmetsp:Transcript_1877/g.6171  ORF Transcript_1877/g.6171 Transcript_1877/m.6171 type:complete len:204 (-) Transcript_1877:864-1475(-)